MLHILLLILKIIGIILAVILGILVLLVCTVVFAPVRYEAKVLCDGAPDTLKAKVRVTWLLHLVSVDVYYKEKRLRWRARLAWKKLTGGERFGDAEDTRERSAAEEESVRGENMDRQTERHSGEKERADEVTEKDVKEDEDQKDRGKDFPQWAEKGSAVRGLPPGEKASAAEKASENEKASETEKKSKTPKKDGKGDQREDEKDPDAGKLQKSVRDFIEKIKTIYHKIKCTIQTICDKIKALSEKKDKVLEFLEDETHTKAFLKLKKEAFKLLGKLKPKKLQIQAVVGFDDPANTGYALAFLSLLYPSFGDHIVLRPDFERKVFAGSIYVKGRVRFSYLIALAWNLIWCRQIRKTYRDIRNFEI